jgi:hypothetical protein
MEQELKKEIDLALTELIQILSSFNEEKINLVPFEGSWTAGQLAQHMIMSNSGFAELMNGPGKETERKPDDLIEDIRSSFLNFSIKFESPDFVRPAKKDYNKHELLRSLNNIKGQLNQAIDTSDLTKTCIAFEVPVLGYLTRLEAAHFVLYHTQRHIHQLKNIFRKLVANNDVSLT